jgi:hypothetical protein
MKLQGGINGAFPAVINQAFVLFYFVAFSPELKKVSLCVI